MIYLQVTKSFRKSDSLFVTFGASSKGAKGSLPTISWWIKQTIMLAYSLAGSPPPLGFQGRSTRGVSASWAELGGVSIAEICRAATWAAKSVW